MEVVPAEPLEVLPGEKSRRMAVAPGEANRVAADTLHTFKLDVDWNRPFVKNSRARPLIPARGARTLSAKISIGQPGNIILGPGQFKDLIRLKSPDICRSFAHRFGSIDKGPEPFHLNKRRGWA